MVRSTTRLTRLPSISTRLKEIDTTRAQLISQLAELDTESHALQRERTSIINDNAAISALPNEILAAIFELGHDSQAFGDHFEILVSSVTQHWQDVALRTPQLWTFVWCAVFGQELETTALYLRRSKSVHIYLWIDLCGENKVDSHDDMDDMCQLLSSHFTRCKGLVVDANDPTCSDDFTKLLRFFHNVSAPSLQRIDISCSDEWSYTKVGMFRTRAQIFTGGAPLLNEISLNNVPLQCVLPPLGSVNAIYLKNRYHSPKFITDEWVQMISSASSLAHLEMDSDMIFRNRATFDMLNIPLLRTLSIRAFGSSFLRYINAPRLEVLVLKEFNFWEPHGIRSNSFLSPHTLVFQDMCFFVGLEYAMVAFPETVHVVCTAVGPDKDEVDTEWAIYQDFLSILIPSDNPSPIFMPDLRTIALPSDNNTIPWRDVRSLLVTRMSIGKPIHKLFVAANRVEEVSAAFPVDEGIVQVEKWKRELVVGWPSWSDLP